MRMWLVDPKLMCKQHLLGEHVELHMLVGHLKRGKSIKGFLDKGLIEPRSIWDRHTVLVEEMTRRGMNHKSALKIIDVSHLPQGKVVDRDKSLTDLYSRCEHCRNRKESENE